jgi:homoserine kinase
LSKELFRIRVPATSAHLGPGYAVLAVALARYAEIAVFDGEAAGHVVTVIGREAASTLDPRHDPLLRALHAAAELWKVKVPPALKILASTDIPLASGLGTAAAGYAAGLAIASRFAKKPPPMDEALGLLTQLGADAAHAAAALHGGLTAASMLTGTEDAVAAYRLISLPLHGSWRFVVALPRLRIGVADARRILPATLPHAATQRTTGRLLGLLKALAEGDEPLLARCMRDEVHVPFRRRLVPGMEEALTAAVAAGAAGATISGHGPGVLALTTQAKNCEPVAMAMKQAFEAAGAETTTMVLEAAAHGAL